MTSSEYKSASKVTVRGSWLSSLFLSDASFDYNVSPKLAVAIESLERVSVTMSDGSVERQAFQSTTIVCSTYGSPPQTCSLYTNTETVAKTVSAKHDVNRRLVEIIHSLQMGTKSGLTHRSAAVQVPQVVELVCQFDQFSLPAALGCVLHLHPLPLPLRQAFVVCDFLYDSSNNRAKLCFQLRGGGVRVLHRVVQQCGLQTRTA